MARFLFTVWPITSHLNSSLSVALTLHQRGHEIAFYTGAPARKLVEDAGFSFFAFDHVAMRLRAILAEDDETAGPLPADDSSRFYDSLMARYSHSYQGVLKSAQQWRAMYREWILGSVSQQVEDLEKVLDAWNPDALVTDPLIWSPSLILREARRQNVAVLSFFAAGCLIPGPDAPPAGLGLPRPRSLPTRLLTRLATAIMDLLSSKMRREASQIRVRYGLSPLRGSVMQHSGKVQLYLVCSTPELDYMRNDLPPSVHYVGACTWDKPSAGTPPGWIAELPTDRPVIFVTEGTAQVTGAAAQRALLLRAAREGLADLQAEVILSTGGREPEQVGLTHLPENMRVVQYVPYSELYPRLSLFVTNGGAQGVRGAMAAGIPLLIVPLEWDQYETAQRVAESGAGIRIAQKDCSAQTIRAAVLRLLNEPTFRDNARRMAQAFARYGNTETAATLLEQHFASD